MIRTMIRDAGRRTEDAASWQRTAGWVQNTKDCWVGIRGKQIEFFGYRGLWFYRC